jgi:hypothetical protein
MGWQYNCHPNMSMRTFQRVVAFYPLCVSRPAYAGVQLCQLDRSCRLDSVDNKGMDSLSVGFSVPRRTPVKMPAQPDLLILKLMQKLGDANPLIRRNAAGALRLQGSRAKAAIPALSLLLKDQDPRVRNEAERAIDHLKLAAA